VVAAGVLFLWTGWSWLDPFISLVIALVILLGTWGLLRQALHLSLDGVPLSVELEQVRDYLAGLPDVSAVHDLHVWAMSTSEVALTAHLVMPLGHAGDAFLCSVTEALHERFGIEHATIQIESNSELCALSHHA
jgi:cobalt-zinc-cadmium efflux system protein